MTAPIGPGARVERLRRRLDERSIPAFLVTNIQNVQYLTGFTGSAGQLLVTPAQALFFADSRYHLRAEKEAPLCQVVKVQPPQKPFEAISDCLKELKVGEVHFEASLPYGTFEELAKGLPDVSLKPARDLVEGLRMVKDAGEIERIRHACQITDGCFEFVSGILRPGITEREVAVEMECFMRRQGAEREAFETIVSAGPAAASPHAAATRRPIESGELVLMDFGAFAGGYAADITRTVAVGPVDGHRREAYDAVLYAQEAAIAAIRPGAKGADIHRLACDVIAARGHVECCFVHGLGHSIGKHVHDGPALSLSSEVTLEAGMVITVEPGIYDPAWGGIRIEDDVLVTEGGCEVLTHAPKAFTVVG